MADCRRYYWDSCVWIGLINEEPEKIASCRHVIEMAQKGEAEIWTSTYTLAEVFKRKCEQVQVGISANQDLAFEDYMESDYVIYAQVDVDVGTLARRLLRAHPDLAKPPDAVHLATALMHNSDELHTFDNANLIVLDGKLDRRDGKKLKICKPPLPVQASLPLLLPTSTAGADRAAPAEDESSTDVES